MKSLIFITMVSLGILTKAPLIVTSPAFNDGGPIPVRYTCDGANISPPIEVRNIPKHAKSLVVIATDPDAPNGGFDHWVVWNIPIPSSDMIDENTTLGIAGKNGKKENRYTGPCPPTGIHHYHFKVFALDEMLNLDNSSGKEAVMKAIDGHVISSGELVGIFVRTK